MCKNIVRTKMLLIILHYEEKKIAIINFLDFYFSFRYQKPT